MIFLLVGGSFSNLTSADMKTPEPGVKVPWVGKDRYHTSSKLIYVTRWKISDLPQTSSSSLRVVLISMGIGFSRVGVFLCLFFVFWFCFFCIGFVGAFCIYALGTVLEKGQTKSWTQRTPESERRITDSEGRNWKSIKYSVSISWTPTSVSLMLKNWKAPLANQLKATSQSQ